MNPCVEEATAAPCWFEPAWLVSLSSLVNHTTLMQAQTLQGLQYRVLGSLEGHLELVFGASSLCTGIKATKFPDTTLCGSELL
jgi:hypothetical protein